MVESDMKPDELDARQPIIQKCHNVQPSEYNIYENTITKPGVGRQKQEQNGQTLRLSYIIHWLVIVANVVSEI